MKTNRVAMPTQADTTHGARRYIDGTSKDGNSAWWAPNTTLDMQWRARKEEGVSLHALALFAQLLEIPHLANRHTPVHKNPLVQTPSICEFRWPRLKSHSVANKCCKVLIIEPSYRVLISLDADGDAVVTGAGLALFFVRIVAAIVS